MYSPSVLEIKSNEENNLVTKLRESLKFQYGTYIFSQQEQRVLLRIRVQIRTGKEFSRRIIQI